MAPAAPSSSPAFDTPELSDLDHAVYEYLCLRGFNSIAQAFMTSTFQCGGSVPVPMSSLYRFWNTPVQDQNSNQPTTSMLTATSSPVVATQTSTVPGAPGEAPALAQATPAIVTAAATAAARPRQSSSSSDKLHTCTWPNCSQSFRKKSNLQRHMLLHEGRRPYRCTVTLADDSPCNKTFARESDLAAHIRVHNGIRPFVCPDCGKKFTRNSDWRAHVKAVHNRAPYPCPGTGCGSRFETLKELRAHFPHCTAVDAAAEQQRLVDASNDDEPQRHEDAGDGDGGPLIPVATPCQLSTCSHNPPGSASPKRFACSGHDQPSFLQVRHDDHIDFLIDGELHHWTDKYCESHGLFNLIDYAPSSMPLSN